MLPDGDKEETPLTPLLPVKIKCAPLGVHTHVHVQNEMFLALHVFTKRASSPLNASCISQHTVMCRHKKTPQKIVCSTNTHRNTKAS